MNAYRITLGPRTAPRLSFEAMAPDSFTAAAQHASLAEPGERLDVVAIDRAIHEWKAGDGYAKRNERRAMDLQLSDQRGNR